MVVSVGVLVYLTASPVRRSNACEIDILLLLVQQILAVM